MLADGVHLLAYLNTTVRSTNTLSSQRVFPIMGHLLITESKLQIGVAPQLFFLSTVIPLKPP